MFLARVAARSVLGRPAVRTLRPAVRGLRSSVVLPSRQSSGNSADQDGFASDDRHVIGALVVNESGVLAGVATLLAGRGFNIDSLVVGRTEIPELSRMTIVINGDDSALTNVQKQLQDVTHVVMVAVGDASKGIVQRDLMMIKVATQTKTDRIGLIQLANVFSAKTVDVMEHHIMFELSSHPAEIERFIELCTSYGIIEIARTGVVGMARASGAFSNMIEDGALVAQRVLERVEMDAAALPPG